MPEKIFSTNSERQFISDYTRYAIYVLHKRMLPDVRDGLKTVQRRILYSMYKDVKAYGNNKVKSAEVVGATAGRYHPHGDTAIYGTIKPMVNWFETNIPLISKQGNFGSFLGDPASSARYTEVKLSEFAYDCILGDLISCPESVDWVDTYTGKILEPEYLPVKVPLLLVNGSFGIGVGIKSEIPIHNLSEVIDTTINLIYDNNTKVVLAPDSSMSTYIFNTDFEDICNKGFGYYTERGIIDIENDIENRKGRTALVIKSVCDLSYLDPISESIEGLIASKKLVQIDKGYDDSAMDVMRYVILLQPGANAEYVRDVIYKNTGMEQRIRINLEAIYGLEPVRFSYKSYLLNFIEFRKITKFRIYNNQLQDVRTKIHERDAYIKALESGEIDNVIKIIRAQKDIKDTNFVEYLTNKLHITDLQAKYILNCDIRKLAVGYLNKYKEEVAVLEDQRENISSKIIGDTNRNIITQEIVDELTDIKKKYGAPRRAKIINMVNTNDIPSGEMTVTLSSNNYIKKSPGKVIPKNVRGTSIVQSITLDNTDSILLFTDTGRTFKLPVNKIPFTDRSSFGTDIRFLIKALTSDIVFMISEKIFRGLPEKINTPDENFIVVISFNGYMKKMSVLEFTSIPSNNGLVYTRLEDGDRVKSILYVGNSVELLIYSKKKATKIMVSDINTQKRVTRGYKCMVSNDPMDGVCILSSTIATNMVVITDSGKVNNIPFSNMPLDLKNKQVFNIIKLSTNDRINTVLSVLDTDIIRVYLTNNVQHDISVSELQLGSSISSGQKLIPVGKNHIYKTEILK